MITTEGNYTNGKLVDKLLWDAVVAAAANRMTMGAFSKVLKRLHLQRY